MGHHRLDIHRSVTPTAGAGQLLSAAESSTAEVRADVSSEFLPHLIFDARTFRAECCDDRGGEVVGNLAD
jgi:hypothetical protein